MAPQPNPLRQYASFNTIFELAVLTHDEELFPDETYRQNPPQLPICRNGGGATNAVTTYFEEQLGKKLEYVIDNVEIEGLVTPNSRTRTTNATTISFQVTEPYSMGLFLQTLKIAATQAGHTNYLSAPFLLILDFMGYDDNGVAIQATEELPLRRFIPMKFTNIEFTVNESGSVYDVQAIPWNEQALMDQMDQVKTDISITGNTLVEMLQNGPNSLTTIMNGRLQERANEGQNAEADEIVITFPQDISSGVTRDKFLDSQEDAGSTVSTPPSGSSSGGGGSGGGGLLGSVVGAVVGGVINGALSGTLQNSVSGILNAFKSGDINAIYQSITGFLGVEAPQSFEGFLSSVVGMVMNRSSMGENLSIISQDEGSVNDLGASNFINSHTADGRPPMGNSGLQYDQRNKVFTRGKNVVSTDERVFQYAAGTKITKIIEEVILSTEWAKNVDQRVPDENGMIDWFRIETRCFTKQNATQNSQNGYKAMVYEYRVVTYKLHHSVLQKPNDPTIGYNSLREKAAKEYNYIYTGQNEEVKSFDIKLNAVFFQATQADTGQNNIDRQTGGISEHTVKEDPEALTITSTTGTSSATGSPMMVELVENSTVVGGMGTDSKRQTALRFHELIINSDIDLVTCELEILGDPFFIFDSGMGNYTAPVESLNVTQDGTMEYQRSQVDILLNFRTPIDYNDETGGMHYPEDTIPVDAFSGLYYVTHLTNSISSGAFTQRLNLIRRRNQEQDTNTDGSDDLAVNVTTATPSEKSHTAF